MLQISVARLHDDNREKLGLAWLAGRPGGKEFVRRDTADGAALVGHLNLIHPNRIQVIGSHEAAYLGSFDASAFGQLLTDLFAARPSAIIIADGLVPRPASYRIGRENPARLCSAHPGRGRAGHRAPAPRSRQDAR